ncbi:hypothetical protein BH23ACT12_BH23ACT12_00110 [soil metagenome]
MSYDRVFMPSSRRDTAVRIARAATLHAAQFAVRKLEPAAARSANGAGPAGPENEPDIYESLYEAHAQSQGDETVVGDLSLAPIEREIVQDAGLKPNQTLLDLGCGIGRLACEVIPWMQDGGGYIGTDVSESMLTRAEQRVAAVVPSPACSVRWIKQVGRSFPLEPNSVDMFCAFSVFTHIEQEDAYGFLCEARRVVCPDGRFVFSCLPMELSDSRFLFHGSAQMDVTARWNTIRNVTTSVDMMNLISNMAGWEPVSWTPGNRERFGQSVCVLKPLADEVLAARPNAWEL